MTVMNWPALDPEQDPRRPAAHIIVGKGVQIERVAQRRIPVTEAMPDFGKCPAGAFMWVWRPEFELAQFAYFKPSAFGYGGSFIDPTTVNDHEFGPVIYDDVTHWCEILPPVIEE